jgi:galactosylceramidase
LHPNYQELASVVDVLGAHYPGEHGPTLAQSLGKPAWSSEDYSQDSTGKGPSCWARVINQNYVAGNLTASIAWNLIDAYYEGLPFGHNGLMRANKPWSGHYIVDNSIWASAHTTQFAKVGWHYLTHGHGSGWLQHGGSYVTLVPPGTTQQQKGQQEGQREEQAAQPVMTMVIEKMNPSTAGCRWEGVANKTTPTAELAQFELAGHLSTVTTLAVWSSHFPGGALLRLSLSKHAHLFVHYFFRLRRTFSHAYTLTVPPFSFTASHRSSFLLSPSLPPR